MPHSQTGDQPTVNKVKQPDKQVQNTKIKTLKYWEQQ